MSTRVQIDANGLRVSRPGSDANGGPAGLLLDTSIRYGQLLDHLLINLTQYLYPDAPNSPPVNGKVNYCDGRFYYGPYRETPDVVCIGIVDGRYEYPPIEFSNYQQTTEKWRLRVQPSADNCYVLFNRASGSIGWPIKMPNQAMLLVYRKPRFS